MLLQTSFFIIKSLYYIYHQSCSLKHIWNHTTYIKLWECRRCRIHHRVQVLPIHKTIIKWHNSSSFDMISLTMCHSASCESVSCKNCLSPIIVIPLVSPLNVMINSSYILSDVSDNAMQGRYITIVHCLILQINASA